MAPASSKRLGGPRAFRFGRALLGALVLSAALMLDAAAAQATSPTQAALDAVISSGSTVTLDFLDGSTRTGRVFTVWPTTLELVIDGQVETISVRHVSRITEQYRDPVSDGLKKGTVRGILVGGIFGAALALSECGNDTFLNLCSSGGFLVIGGLMAGTGAGIGAVAGFIGDVTRQSHRVVWPVPASGAKIVSRNLAVPSRLGLRAAISW